MLLKHRGEVEYDFRHEFHDSFRHIVGEDVDEALRLAKQLLTNPGTRLAAAVGGWDRPVSVEAIIAAGLFTAWTDVRHPLMPEVGDNSLTDVESRLADLALENMNRR